MKRFLSTILAIICLISAQAQEHMTFKGLSMDCDYSAFIAKLKAKGFVLKFQEDYGAVLTGEFAGKSDCTIFVLPTKQTKRIWKVSVNFPKRDSWYSLKNEYQTFKESYINKYGEPSSSYEYFRDPYYDGDGYELQAVSLEKVSYISFFQTATGCIALEITKDKCIQVSYEDAINVALKNKEQETSISEDI